ncbi:HSP20 family protein [Marchantia polymorpha subsp. ruderalis]
MALIPRAFGTSLFDPFFGSSVFDPVENLSLSLFDRVFSSFDEDVSAVAKTRVDWLETPEAHVFKADLPGMRKEEIKVQVVDDGILRISGERNKETVDEKHNYRRTERSFGKFSRQFRLPSNAKALEISAKVENGVLTVTVPKIEESKKKCQVRNVEIDG